MEDIQYGMDLPLIAILRGVEPDEAADIGRALVTAGFKIIEVPLNSPNAIDSIERLSNAVGGEALIGAGTVLDVEDVEAVGDAGGSLIVMPHVDSRIIATAKGEDMICIPGVATITEAFDALSAGADALKVFPAEVLGPATINAWRAVLPEDVILLPVGGVTPDNLAEYYDAGADGFGIGSALYRPGDTAEDVASHAEDFIEAWEELVAGNEDDEDDDHGADDDDDDDGDIDDDEDDDHPDDGDNKPV